MLYERPELGFEGLVKDVTTHSTVIVKTLTTVANEPFVGV